LSISGLHIWTCKIYSPSEIAAAKASPSFPREYDLAYAGLIGNVFHITGIVIAKGKSQNMGDFPSILL
jgi:hypothetical protein